jgi:hypothetical protein
MMSARARLLVTMTGFDTVIISRAVPPSTFRSEPGASTALQSHRHIGTKRRCDGALVVYYVAEPENVSTLELHSLFGFSPTGRMVNVPGAERPLILHRLAT